MCCIQTILFWSLSNETAKLGTKFSHQFYYKQFNCNFNCNWPLIANFIIYLSTVESLYKDNLAMYFCIFLPEYLLISSSISTPIQVVNYILRVIIRVLAQIYVIHPKLVISGSINSFWVVIMNNQMKKRKIKIIINRCHVHHYQVTITTKARFLPIIVIK